MASMVGDILKKRALAVCCVVVLIAAALYWRNSQGPSPGDIGLEKLKMQAALEMRLANGDRTAIDEIRSLLQSEPDSNLWTDLCIRTVAFPDGISKKQIEPWLNENRDKLVFVRGTARCWKLK